MMQRKIEKKEMAIISNQLTTKNCLLFSVELSNWLFTMFSKFGSIVIHLIY